MKFSVSSYSFGSYNSLGIKGLIDKSKEMGFDGIEFTDGKWVEDYNLTLADDIKKYAENVGIEIVAFLVGADFIKGNIEAEIDRLKKCVDFTAALGAKLMRHDVAWGFPEGQKVGMSYDANVDKIADAVRKVTVYAKSNGVQTMTENHGYFSQDSARVEKLINTVNDENFGALVDLGNFMCADENPNMAVGIMAKYAKHVHAKDFFWKSGSEINPGEGWFNTRAGNYLRGAIIGHGVANIYQSIQILKREGYDGYITVEFEGMEDNLKGIQIGLDNLKRFVAG